MSHLPALEASLELAVTRSGDPQPAIYARLFALHPAMEAEFWRDGSGRIRGEMLARSFEMVLDLAAPHAPEGGQGIGGWGSAFLGTEAVTHDAYGIPRAVFADFLPIMAGVIRDTCGDGFTPAMAAAWDLVLDRAAATLAALPGSSMEARVIDVDDVLPPRDERGIFFPMR
ncbi:globin [Sandarakinorhabdus oryzae]|uniref:globin n=1 Tax=Sandarakinorhabdus oryzae TaxID=2675220 RepID=UPI0012E1FB3D|nr:globin [Sandarakinorhabdus oryzae]